MTLEGQPWSSGQAPRTSVSDGLLALEEAHRAKRRSSAPILSRPWPAALIQSPTVWGYRKEDKIPTVHSTQAMGPCTRKWMSLPLAFLISKMATILEIYWKCLRR